MKQKYIFGLTFITVTLFYLGTRWLIFLGFNGADDLHYAMLSSRLLNGTFNPFIPNDIFCGRIVLIGFQSFIYWLSGIGVLTTQIGTLSSAVLSCYLLIFKIIKPKSNIQLLLACSLFYFNPVLLNATLGILPDSYIMLLGICFVLALKNILEDKMDTPALQNSFWLGILIGASLLIKEISIIFLLSGILLMLIRKPRRFLAKAGLLTLGFLLMVSIVGTYYYVNTGNFFFKLLQINNSDYRNTIHLGFDLKNTLIRLTYGPWQVFIVHGYYPLLLALFVLILQLFTKGWLYVKNNYYLFSFLLLLLLSLYFPFSLQEFKPLYIETRHFLFLLPLAVSTSSDYIYSEFSQNKKKRPVFLFLLCLLVICVLSTGNKWQWMIYGLLTALFFIGPLLKSNFQIIILCSICWLSFLESVFFRNNPWFKEMHELNRNISGNCFYFTENDNMMHWELLRKFDTTSVSYYNIQKKPFFMFAPYYQKIDTTSFKPGWLIVNKVYPEPSVSFQRTLNELQKTNGFGNSVIYKHMEAFYIADSITMKRIMANTD